MSFAIKMSVLLYINLKYIYTNFQDEQQDKEDIRKAFQVIKPRAHCGYQTEKK